MLARIGVLRGCGCVPSCMIEAFWCLVVVSLGDGYYQTISLLEAVLWGLAVHLLRFSGGRGSSLCVGWSRFFLYFLFGAVHLLYLHSGCYFYSFSGGPGPSSISMR